MTTLTERLTAAANNKALAIGDAWNLIQEAAEEIERLTKERDDIKIPQAAIEAAAKAIEIGRCEDGLYHSEDIARVALTAALPHLTDLTE